MYVSLGLGLLIGTSNLALLATCRSKIPSLFTRDPEVMRQMLNMLPICAAFQVLDGLVSSCNGILCAAGRPKLASRSQLSSCYLIGLPLSFYLAFQAEWKLLGIWTGCFVSFAVIAVLELWFVFRLDWQRALSDAEMRNKM